MPESVLALETLLARLRSVRNAMLTLDGFTRWGMHDDDDRARANAEGERLYPDEAETIAKLRALVSQTRRDQRSAIEAWVDAHQRLLRDFVLASAGDSNQSTARSVAEGEIQSWERVRAGELDFVDENVGYVHVDTAQYRAMFGFGLMPGPSSRL
jgi:hypothetical protein